MELLLIHMPGELLVWGLSMLMIEIGATPDSAMCRIRFQPDKLYHLASMSLIMLEAIRGKKNFKLIRIISASLAGGGRP